MASHKIHWHTEEFIVDSVATWYPCFAAVKGTQICTTMNDSWSVNVLILCLLFAKCGVVRYGKTTPLCSCLSKRHCSRNLMAAMFFSEKIDFCLVTFSNKPQFFSLFIIVLSWTFNADWGLYSLRCSALVFCGSSQHFTVWPFGEFEIPGKIVALCYGTSECPRAANCHNFCFYGT